MLFVRKIYFVQITVLIFVIYFLFSSLPETPSHDDGDDSEEYYSSPLTSQNGARFRWTKHPEKHPVTKYIPLPTGAASPIPRIQYNFPGESWYNRRERVKRQDAVKEAFEHAWKGYKKHAWLRDELSPLSGDNRETFAGWAATLVDSLDSLLIMGMTKDFEKALEAIEKIDFMTTTATQINVFETNIRYLGGFLAAYDLTNGTYPVLLDKAVEVADFIYGAFDTSNRMPQSRWQWTRSAEGQSIQPSPNTILAELGSLNLEFTRLSQLTGNDKYFDAIQRIADNMEKAQKQTRIPGLWPVMVNAADLEFRDARYTVGGMADSMYEYLPKEHILLGARTEQWRNMYSGAMDAIKENILYRPMTKHGEDILIAGNTNAASSGKRTLEPQGEHLKCFIGGTVGIGAKVFNRPQELSIARKLVDGCIWAYDIMPTGIMPEIFYTTVCENKDFCKWDEKKWHEDVFDRLGGWRDGDITKEVKGIIERNGLQPGITTITDPTYKLRPEAIESVFIMYRITGDKALQDAAWRMFQNIEKYTRTELAHAAIDDVRRVDTAQTDYMESFWLAETLKYFYLIFSEPELISLDDYVLNTEAHPFKRPSTE